MFVNGGSILTTDVELLLRDREDDLFGSVFYRKMVNCVWEDTWFEKIIIAHAKLVPVPNRASEFKIPKTPRKEGMIPIFNELVIT